MPRELAEILGEVGLPHDEGEGRHRRRGVAQMFSNKLAIWIADALRPHFEGIKPSSDGTGLESRSRSAKGYKKLDVNYSTLELGLGLGISIKTVNSVDPKTGRFDHNYTRIDTELVTEAIDYHKRQPYAVLIGVLFLPMKATETGAQRLDLDGWVSDFARAIVFFRHRAHRRDPGDDADFFEKFFVALYSTEDETIGNVTFYSVDTVVPRSGPPQTDEGLSFEAFIEEVTRIYDQRNKPPVEWSS